MLEELLQQYAAARDKMFDAAHQVVMPTWHTGCVVLVGDSAWWLTLYSGMGASAGLAGADLLPRSQSDRMLSSSIAVEEVALMASIVVRGLDESVKKQLATQAKEHGRSMEAEVRDILTKAAHRPHIGLALMQAARDVGGVDDFPVPERTDTARTVDFG